jgi:lysophospholipase L1-like esterase
VSWNSRNNQTYSPPNKATIEKLSESSGKLTFNGTTITQEKWTNKKANFLGDSITQGTGTTKTYHAYLQESSGLSVVRNYGISGSTISNSSNPMHSRSLTMDTDADLICVFGGTNDFFFNVPLGSLYTLDGSGNRIVTINTAQFYGALHQLCKNLISTYPGKQIVLFTPLHREVFGTQPTELQKNTAGLFIEDYVNAIVDIGKWYSIPVLDLYRVSGLQPNEPSNKSLYFSPTDGLHPNAAGHQVIANKLQLFINAI